MLTGAPGRRGRLKYLIKSLKRKGVLRTPIPYSSFLLLLDFGKNTIFKIIKQPPIAKAHHHVQVKPKAKLKSQRHKAATPVNIAKLIARLTIISKIATTLKPQNSKKSFILTPLPFIIYSYTYIISHFFEFVNPQFENR